MLRIFLLLLLFNPIISFASCLSSGWDQTVTLKKINDGDTVTLDNGRLVRFIGIDTPEINHKNLSKSEDYALEAKQLLQRYIKPGDKLRLVFDKTKQDKYGRKLAYVHSKTGRNLALMLLKAGLARHWVIGKNDQFWQCFQQAEKQARLRKRGIWKAFSPLTAKRLKKSDRGYLYIKGRVSRVEESKKGLKVMLDKQLTLSISNKQLSLFHKWGVNFYPQQKILVNGKVSVSRKKHKMNLYHPAQLLP